MVTDLAPPLAAAFFSQALKATQTPGQAAILVILGLQRRELSDAAAALQLPSAQVLALFLKSMKRFVQLLKSSKEGEIERSLPNVDTLQVGKSASLLFVLELGHPLPSIWPHSASAMHSQSGIQINEQLPFFSKLKECMNMTI
jgi:hypothetical protein